MQGQLTALREETAQLATVEERRSFTQAERHRVAQLKLHAEGIRLKLLRLRAAVEDALREGREGRAGGS